MVLYMVLTVSCLQYVFIKFTETFFSCMLSLHILLRLPVTCWLVGLQTSENFIVNTQCYHLKSNSEGHNRPISVYFV